MFCIFCYIFPGILTYFFTNIGISLHERMKDSISENAEMKIFTVHILHQRTDERGYCTYFIQQGLRLFHKGEK